MNEATLLFDAEAVSLQRLDDGLAELNFYLHGGGLLDIANLKAVAQGHCAASEYCMKAHSAFLESRAPPKNQD